MDIAKAYADFIVGVIANKPDPELNKEDVIKSSWQRTIDAAVKTISSEGLPYLLVLNGHQP